jgi:hypothetical protein
MYHLKLLIERGFSLIKRMLTDLKTGYFPDKSGRIKIQVSENHIAESDIKIRFLHPLNQRKSAFYSSYILK